MAKEHEARPRSAIEDAATLDEASLKSTRSSPGISSAKSEGEVASLVEQEARVSVAADKVTTDPARIGRYVILRRLGQGGMGVVYSAYDADLDRKVAVKVVRNSLQYNSMGRARVLKEAQAMARIAHPNVVHVYEVGQDTSSSNAQVFIAMELVAGISLREWQRQRRSSSLDEIVRLYLQATAGLSAAHRCGLIHRDFKPDNVLVGEDGRARVVDFGLARALDGPLTIEPLPASAPRRSGSMERLTEVGSILGTPGYMAPEQVMGEATDARSDQFSFCVALYEALYQQLPFAGDTLEEFSDNVLAGNLQSPPQGQAASLETPILVEKALRRGLSRDPAARFPSMQELIAALETGLAPDADSQRTRQRKKWATGAMLGSMLLVLAIRLGSQQTAPPGSGLRGGMMMGWIMLLIVATIVLVLRKQILKQPLYRRFVHFALLFVAYVAIGRSLGYLAQMTRSQFHMLEALGMAALFTAEIPNVGKQYAWPAALCLVFGLLRLVITDFPWLLGNLIYAVVLTLGVYLRPWTPKSAAKLSESGGAGIPPR